MKLLTKEIEKQLPPLYSQEKVADPLCIVHFFNPTGAGDWYATEYDPAKRLFFGWVKIHEGELGYFTLDQLEQIKLPLGLKIERELAFTPTPLSVVQKQKGG
jgi:hypothetical protein